MAGATVKGLAAILGLWLSLAVAAVAASDVILARTQPDVVLVWRVNDTLAGDVASHPPTAMLQAEIVSAGLARMARALPAGSSPHATVRLKIVYFNDGGYDPTYRIETVSGVRRVGEIWCTVDQVRRMAKPWKASLDRNRLPSGLAVHFEPDAFDGL